MGPRPALLCGCQWESTGARWSGAGRVIDVMVLCCPQGGSDGACCCGGSATHTVQGDFGGIHARGVEKTEAPRVLGRLRQHQGQTQLQHKKRQASNPTSQASTYIPLGRPIVVSRCKSQRAGVINDVVRLVATPADAGGRRLQRRRGSRSHAGFVPTAPGPRPPLTAVDAAGVRGTS